MKRILLASMLLLAAAPGYAAVEVHTTTNFPGSISKIAVAPLPCHEEVNCQRSKKPSTSR